MYVKEIKNKNTAYKYKKFKYFKNIESNNF